MKIYLSSNQLPELANHLPRERHEILIRAEQKLTVPEKLILNLLKLLMLVPPFLYLARQEWLMLTIALVATLFIKLTIFTPIKLAFCRKHIVNMK
ncbi:DUF6170 family protein [Thalassotalea piscium]|uniref:Uncharacterized protein n=1 Tax=Thalassotalea piscium TaxID=1230533 RepID=A0A7X0NFX7_9GAMM|nr:DUF6170 family protein [Thalassotalea piscium]MBB6542741.1 hypothetical protein [Thalassotalea piscium]